MPNNKMPTPVVLTELAFSQSSLQGAVKSEHGESGKPSHLRTGMTDVTPTVSSRLSAQRVAQEPVIVEEDEAPMAFGFPCGRGSVKGSEGEGCQPAPLCWYVLIGQ